MADPKPSREVQSMRCTEVEARIFHYLRRVQRGKVTLFVQNGRVDHVEHVTESFRPEDLTEDGKIVWGGR